MSRSLARLVLIPLVLLVLPLTLPAPALAQSGVGVGVKAGTMGVGLEGALALTPNLGLRAGGAMLPLNPQATFSDITFELDLPGSFMTLGLDFYPGGGGFRLSGGVLYKPDHPTLRGTFTEPQEIGGRTYTPEQIGTLVGVIDSGTTAPFAMIGFGRHTRAGIGLFMDFGAAFLKEAALSLSSEGGSLSGAERQEFENRLETERQQIEDDIGGYLRIYPIIQLGLRMGLGR